MFKSKTSFPPGGWQFYEEKTKWTAPGGLTFDGLVRKVIEHRRNNPKVNLAHDLATVSWDVELQNGKRIHYHPVFWDSDLAKKKMNPGQANTSPPQRWWQGNPQLAALVKLAGKIKQSVSGARVLKDWLGDGGLPVSIETATSRAAVCGPCPMNQKLDWMSVMTAEVANAIKEQRETKLGLNLTVPNEEELGTCSACSCHLALKVFVPFKYIEQEMDEETFNALHEDCWVRKEKWKQLLLVIPYCKSDMGQAQELLKWIEELGGCKGNPCLLVADCKVPATERNAMKALAEKSFAKVEAITTPFSLPNERWPIGPNWMFETTLRHVFAKYDQPFYWCEPDCIPLKPDWLEALEVEYNMAGKPFMGAVVSSSGQANLPGDHLTGCAVYPQNAHELLQHIYGGKAAFDMAMAETVLPLTHQCLGHFHFWGQKGLPPTFKVNRSPQNPENTLLLGVIPRDSIIFHRNKDSSLIKLLREQMI